MISPATPPTHSHEKRFPPMLSLYELHDSFWVAPSSFEGKNGYILPGEKEGRGEGTRRRRKEETEGVVIPGETETSLCSPLLLFGFHNWFHFRTRGERKA
mmetsp:Transcript_11480/g.30479  ORF Transcript_11480/g.30479 Transcript_11480/m.30479 type:complete len:100 (-) Transcript_11480:327-626(-)